MLSFKQCTRNISYISRSHWRNHSHSQGPARGVLRSWPTGRQTQTPSSCNHATLTQDRDRRLLLLSGDTSLNIIPTIMCTGNPRCTHLCKNPAQTFGYNTNTCEPYRIAPKNDVHAHAHKDTHTLVLALAPSLSSALPSTVGHDFSCRPIHTRAPPHGHRRGATREEDPTKKYRSTALITL